MEGCLARLARSMQMGSAFGSLGFFGWDQRVLNQPVLLRRERGRERIKGVHRRWYGYIYIYSLKWPYRHPRKQGLDKAIILSQRPKHLLITRDIDKDRKGIFRYRLYISNPINQLLLLVFSTEPGGPKNPPKKKAQLTA